MVCYLAFLLIFILSSVLLMLLFLFCCVWFVVLLFLTPDIGCIRVEGEGEIYSTRHAWRSLFAGLF